MENKIKPIVDTIRTTDGIINLGQDRFDLIRKYLLIQTIRTKSVIPTLVFEEGSSLKMIDELCPGIDSKKEYWESAISEILKSSWEDLKDSENVIVKEFSTAQDIMYICVARTGGEYMINDLGHGCEKLPVSLDLKPITEYVSEEYGVKTEDKLSTNHITSCTLFPLDPENCIISFHPYWARKEFDPYSPGYGLRSPVICGLIEGYERNIPFDYCKKKYRLPVISVGKNTTSCIDYCILSSADRRVGLHDIDVCKDHIREAVSNVPTKRDYSFILDSEDWEIPLQN